MNRLMPLLLAVLLALAGVGALTSCNLARPAPRTRVAVPACPPDTLYQVNAYHWPHWVVLRFMRSGHVLMPPNPFTQRTCGDWSLNEQFRCGPLYFIDNTPLSGLAGRVERVVWCAQGRDTMRVVFWPYYQQNVFYDSIPFRPGTFLLYDPWRNEESQARHYGNLPTSTLGGYYAEHAAELARQNAFADLHFSEAGRRYWPSNKVPGAPNTPAQIFESVLQRTTYVGVRWTRLVPIHQIAKPERYVSDYYQVYRADNPVDSVLVANP